MNSNLPIQVICAADGAFLRHIPTVVKSIQAHTSHELELGIVSVGWRQVDQDSLSAALPDVNLRFIELNAEALSGLRVKLVLSPMSYARVFMADLVEWDKFIYLDVDMIVRSDIAELFQVPLENTPAAAVFHGGKLNAGLMVINAKIWRERKLASKIIYYARTNEPKEADQESIEKVVGMDFIRLDETWNVLVDPVWGGHMLTETSYLQNAKILHFITGFKPWNAGRFLLPKSFASEWKKYQVRSDLPIDWKYEAKTVFWQTGILIRRVFKRLSG